MPTLFRFLMIIALIGGTVAGSLYVLAEYFQPEPKEISKSLRGVKAHEAEASPPNTASPAAPPDAAAPSAPAPVASDPAAPAAPSGSVQPQ